jgi:hypothetical protein
MPAQSRSNRPSPDTGVHPTKAEGEKQATKAEHACDGRRETKEGRFGFQGKTPPKIAGTQKRSSVKLSFAERGENHLAMTDRLSTDVAVENVEQHGNLAASE